MTSGTMVRFAPPELLEAKDVPYVPYGGNLLNGLHYRGGASWRRGAVKSNTSRTGMGVTRSDMKKVPQNPKRRWIPQSPVSRQKIT